MERTLDPTFRARAFQWIDGVTVPAPQAARTLAVGRQDKDHLACAQTQKSGCSTGRSALLSAYRTQQLGHNAMSVLCQFQLRAILPPPRAVSYMRDLSPQRAECPQKLATCMVAAVFLVQRPHLTFDRPKRGQ